MYHPWGQCDPNNEKLEHFDTYSGPNCFRECFRNILEGSRFMYLFISNLTRRSYIQLFRRMQLYAFLLRKYKGGAGWQL